MQEQLQAVVCSGLLDEMELIQVGDGDLRLVEWAEVELEGFVLQEMTWRQPQYIWFNLIQREFNGFQVWSDLFHFRRNAIHLGLDLDQVGFDLFQVEFNAHLD